MKKIRPASAHAIAITGDELRAVDGGAPPGANLGRSTHYNGRRQNPRAEAAPPLPPKPEALRPQGRDLDRPDLQHPRPQHPPGYIDVAKMERDAATWSAR